MSLIPVENNSKTTANTTTKTKAPTMKFFLGESGYNITILDSLTATGRVNQEKIETILKRSDLLLAECNGKSLIISAIAPNGLNKMIGYFSANDTNRELFKENVVEAYKVIANMPLIEAVSSEDFIDSWDLEPVAKVA